MTSTIAPATPNPAKASLWHRLYHGETTIDFVGKRNVGFFISGFVLLISLISLILQGLNLGVDFKGGVVWEPPATGSLTVAKAVEILGANGISESQAKVQTLTGSSGNRVRVQVGVQTNEVQSKIRDELAVAAGVDIQEVPLSSVSASWGNEITDKAIRALIIFFVALTIYIAFRFEIKMAIGAFAAVLHDVLIAVGIYSLLRFAVTPATVIAFLTILGFSLYDTIVVFDKVHENTKRLSSGRYSYGDIVNLSMNQTLMRSINTSLAALLPVMSLLIVGSGLLGAVAIRDFALALFIGLLASSYSSIFIATPVLAILKEREPRYKALKARLQASAGAITAAGSGAASAAASTTSTITTDDMKALVTDEAPRRNAATITAAGQQAGLGHAPRPRKKKRR